MKLILTESVTGLGNPGDVVEVKDGYGRNFLLPRGLAVAWTKGGEKQVTQIKRARKMREIRDRDHAQEVKVQLEGLSVRVAAKAGETGKLFGSVTNVDVATAVRAAGGPLLEKRAVALKGAVKNLGPHKATLTLHPDVVATVTFEVVAE